MRKWVCDRCNKELKVADVIVEYDCDLCKSCADELERLLDNFFKSKPVSFPNSEV